MTGRTTSQRRRAHGWPAVILVAALAALSLSATDGSPAAACADPPLSRSFDDVSAGGTFTAAIGCIAGYGVVGGFEDGTFAPSDPVTRAEAAKFLANLVELADGGELPQPSASTFTDVDPSGEFGEYVLRLAQAGIVQGRTATSFSPQTNLTRGQMSAIVARALAQLEVPLEPGTATYPDVPADGVFTASIAQLTDAGIVTGRPDGTFRPDAPVTRGELAGFLARGAQTAADGGAFLPVAGPLDEGDWEPVIGSLEHARVSIPGPRVVNLLRWDLDDPEVALTADWSGGGTSAADMVTASNREGVVAAVNGGFWRPGNDPNGLLVKGGRMFSDPSTYHWFFDDQQVMDNQFRSAFGLRDDGTAVVGQVEWQATVTLNGTSIPVDAINRQPWGSYRDSGALYVTRPADLARMDESGYYFALNDVADLNRSGTTGLTVTDRIVGAGPLNVPPGQSGVFVPDYVAEGMGLGAVIRGDAVSIEVTMDPAWEGTRTALVGGPGLLAGGNATSEDDWRYGEAFEYGHLNNRNPRTAIGFTGQGQGVIVTVDGRRPGVSIGMTTSETIQLLQTLQLSDAVMMDGGASTQMAIDGQLQNRPSGDSDLRQVVTAMLFKRTS